MSEPTNDTDTKPSEPVKYEERAVYETDSYSYNRGPGDVQRDLNKYMANGFVMHQKVGAVYVLRRVLAPRGAPVGPPISPTDPNPVSA